MKPALALLALVWTLAAAPAAASDHKESPMIAGRPTADIADLYAFLAPDDGNRLVLAMTVSPSMAPEMARTYQFSSTTRYLFKVDSDGDYIADHTVAVRFTRERFPELSPAGELLAGQEFAARFGRDLPPIRGAVTPASQVFARPLPPLIATGRRGTRVFAGARDDPFFFDTTGSFRVFGGTLPKFTAGIDRNAGMNVAAIVVELPLDLYYRGQPLHIWATTEILDRSHGRRPRWRQVQRDGNPAVKAVYITPEYKDLYNRSEPVDDAARFSAVIEGSARYLFGLDDADMARLLGMLVPDVLTLDPTRPIGLPNGRHPDDDIDPMFWFNLDRPIAYAPGDLDGVRHNDVPNGDRFPYLAAPHTVPMY